MLYTLYSILLPLNSYFIHLSTFVVHSPSRIDPGVEEKGARRRNSRRKRQYSSLIPVAQRKSKHTSGALVFQRLESGVYTLNVLLRANIFFLIFWKSVIHLQTWKRCLIFYSSNCNWCYWLFSGLKGRLNAYSFNFLMVGVSLRVYYITTQMLFDLSRTTSAIDILLLYTESKLHFLLNLIHNLKKQ